MKSRRIVSLFLMVFQESGVIRRLFISPRRLVPSARFSRRIACFTSVVPKYHDTSVPRNCWPLNVRRSERSQSSGHRKNIARAIAIIESELDFNDAAIVVRLSRVCFDLELYGVSFQSWLTGMEHKSCANRIVFITR